MADVVISDRDLTLYTDGLSYDLRSGLLRRIFIGVSRRQGFTPIQHLNGAELKTRHAFSFLIVPLGLAIGGAALFYFGLLQHGLTIPLAIEAALGLLLLILWFFARTTRLVFYSEGSTFIEMRASSEQEAREFIAKYRALKSHVTARPKPAAPTVDISGIIGT